MPLAPGTLLHNRYRIVSILGQGGMGAVYRAHDEHLNVPVAVKENLFLTDEYARQFQREAQILAGLRHPNLPHVSDYFDFEHQGQYLVMDYIEGEDLRQRMERVGNLPERETILVGISICEALSYLHSRRPAIVHRDLKPGNIKITPEGNAVLVDFGLAKIMVGSQATSTGARAMTPGYSPPEQYGTARTDPRSDIYSLGATLYAAITGVIPEDGLARMTGKTDLTPIRDLVPRASRRLSEAIEKAMAVDPKHRYQSAEDFRNALVAAGEMEPVFLDRPTISPPPNSIQAHNAALILNDENENGDNAFQRVSSASRRRLKRQIMRVMMMVTAAFILASIGIAVIWRNNLPFAAGFLQSPGEALPTEISAAGTNGTFSASLPSDTPIAATTAPQASASPASSTETPSALMPLPTETPAFIPSLTPSPTALGGGPSQMAFVSDRSGKMQIYMMNSNGTDQRQLTGVSGGACQPSWSPDGMRIAFISPCKGKEERYEGSSIHVLDLAANEITELPFSPQGDYDPAWSPDGKRIAFTSLRGGKPAIFTIDLATNTVLKLSNSSYAERQPTWSPDGYNIAFVRQISTISQIWTMSHIGESQAQFSKSGNASNVSPAWSPDGQVIYYIQSSLDVAMPRLMGLRFEDRNTANEFRIVPKTEADLGPVAGVSLSPDGIWLAFEGWPNSKHDIYLMRNNGTELRRLTTDPGVDFGPIWRPRSDLP